MRILYEFTASDIDDILYKHLKEETIFDTEDTIQFKIKDGQVTGAVLKVYVDKKEDNK